MQVFPHGGLGTAADVWSWGRPRQLHRAEAGLDLWTTTVLDQGTAVLAPDRLTVDQLVTVLRAPVARPVTAPSPDPTTRATVTVWEPRALTGRWEARVRIVPGDDPAAVVGMDLASADGFQEQVSQSSLDSRTVAAAGESAATGWHHWAVERTPASTRYFLDGRLLSDTPSAPDQAGPVRLRWWISPADEAARTPAQAEFDWVAFYPTDGS